MTAVLSKAGCFVAIIVLGQVLRRAGFFGESDFSVLARIVTNITLPASIVFSYSGKQIDTSMLLISLLGLSFGIVYILAGYFTHLHRGKEAQAFALLNISGYNIGNFAMPFCQGFLGPMGVITTSLFDTGNAFICLGSAYSVAAMVQNGDRFSLRRVLRDLLRSVPFVTYIIMTSMALAHITLPGPVTELAGILGNANAPLAMLMLGVGFRISGDRSQFAAIVKLLSIRYLLAAAAACLCYFVLPFEPEICQALTVLCFSPIASLAPPFTGEVGGDTGLASAVNSISIVISLLCMVAVLVMIL